MLDFSDDLGFNYNASNPKTSKLNFLKGFAPEIRGENWLKLPNYLAGVNWLLRFYESASDMSLF